MSFNEAFTATMGSEGGYSNDPQDRGGETYMGISRNNHPGWPGWVIIDACLNSGHPLEYRETLGEMVMSFYREQFWEKSGCHLVDKISPKVANELFDSAVNCGPKNGGKFLQSALNALNVNGSLFPDIEVDGKVGPGTVKAVAACCKTKLGEGLLFRCQNGEQYIYYKGLSQHERYRGWFGRTG